MEDVASLVTGGGKGYTFFTTDIYSRKNLFLIMLTMALFYSTVPVNNDSVPALGL